MEIVWRNLKVEEFNKICRLCLANKQLLEPLAQEEKNTLIKLTPWIAQLETSAFFPNKICAECSKQLHQVNEFLNRCNTLSNSFHRCIEEYKVSAKNDSKIPSLETLFTTKVPIKQEVEEIEDDSEEEPCPTMPFTEVFMDEIKKETDEVMEFEDTKFIPQQTTSNSAESSSKFDNGESVEVTPDIPASNAKDTLLPAKSKQVYEETYARYKKWRLDKKIQNTTEDTILSYFNTDLAAFKISTLWTKYSMLCATIKFEEGVDISKFSNMMTYLKSKRDGYKPKKSLTLSKENIENFLVNADEEQHLLNKVVLIFGVSGGCRRQQLVSLTTTDVEDHEKYILVKLIDRSFVILPTGNIDFLQLIRKYMALRPKKTSHTRFFVNYFKQKCTVQPVGIHKIGSVPSIVAKFLNLPDAGSYTGHCFRRTSATLLANIGEL